MLALGVKIHNRTSYYVFELLLTVRRYAHLMSKKVVSFRFSDEELQAIDKACARFGKNRSQIVSFGVATLLRDYVHEDGTLLKRTPWLVALEDGAKHDKN